MTTLLLLLWLAAADQAGSTTTAVPQRGEVILTYLANEGFLIRHGDDAVLIDAFVGMPYAGFPALPANRLKQLELGEPPFDSVDVALVSHVHGDHFQPAPARAFMASVPEAILASTPQVVAQHAEDYPPAAAHADRVRETLPPPGAWVRFEHAGVSIEVMHLSHGTGRFAGMQNLGHLIHVGGMTLLHVGDAAMVAANFAPYHLAHEDIDVALLPYWYWDYPEGRALIEEHLKADVHVACHVPLKGREQILARLNEQHPNVVTFDRSFEGRRIKKRRKTGQVPFPD